MLDSQILDQLKGVYQNLENQIELVYNNSEHAKQAELVEMLNSLAQTSDKISVSASSESANAPSFSIKYNGEFNGVSFVGIPGGHEFTSLVLAILNSDLKGKLPDEGIIRRIKSIKGDVKLRTYISLSCENCPEVVQSLNLISILNSNISHEMVDGEFEQEEIERLKIQGVPSVMVGDELFSSGKTNLAALLTKLEEKFGSVDLSDEDRELGTFDVVVVGAGPAGASAAIYSARKGLKTVVIAEKVGGQVSDTKGIENLISVPYTEGPELSSKLLGHMNEYDISILEHRLVKKVENSSLKELTLSSGETLKTKSLIIATGAKWRELGIEGEKEYTGRGVAYCPHCDGPYYKGKDVAVIGGGNSGVEAAIDLAGIVKSVTLYEFLTELKADEVLVKKLESLDNVNIIKNARTSKVIGDGDKVVALEYENREDGSLHEQKLDGVFVQIGLSPNSSFIKDVVNTNKFGEIEIDTKCRTNIAGIYAAGDVTTVPYKQIIISMGEGAKAALAAFEDNMTS
ncbi:alkyl hydroperoxide reductase subunit F [Halobacteriovorax marinus SJ]|uniref:Alkyl hydroperoxide reductase subunit F n=1 Tax=Halobacteriovorax marinus (strain ATCC BAA-682 / DSM 15412 / SJ) TaxID=862908 RepID=E1X0N8_HALMS|nr:alkyl hydroperoxide reductase subunit F [Halobacteriovorax marinus]CBW26376.1 alkyl hydroperoxide reductase subunit F [Halobacteriovorax marinus SJ]